MAQSSLLSGFTSQVWTTAAAVCAAVDTACARMRTERIKFWQLQTWDYLDGPGAWLEQLRLLCLDPRIGHLGLTNFDTAHARVVLASGLPVVSNQVCFSLFDRRVAGIMSEICAQSGLRLIAFGV